MFTHRTLLLAMLFVAVLSTAAASCPDLVSGESGEPRWAWDLIYWIYDGSYSSTAVGNAASAWTSAQSVVDIEPYNFSYTDIQVHDSESIGDDLGETLNHGQDEDSGCSDTYDLCGRCMNHSFMFYSEVWLSPTNNQNEAAYYRGLGVSVTDVQEFQMTAAHELGHVVDLDDDMGATNCSDPSIMSYTDSNECSPIFLGPQFCDGNSVYTSYNGYSVLPFSECAGCGNGSCI